MSPEFEGFPDKQLGATPGTDAEQVRDRARAEGHLLHVVQHTYEK